MSVTAKKKTRAVDLKAIPLPEKPGLSEEHLAHLRTSGISDETIQLANLYTERLGTRIAGLLHWTRWQTSLGTAIVFPFFIQGRPDPVMYRVRPDQPRSRVKRGKKKLVKYEQPKDVAVLPYFPPRARTHGWYQDAARPLYWVEGEKKGLVLDQLGYAAIAGTGVDGFHDVEHRDEHDAWRLHEAIRDGVTIAGRDHYI
ncbi:MAG: DUF3854 domain-containing protein, partial [Polyangiaceae bacterium]|nr:DUF3854 domain-containing protein [Polyangiaceae bacterium]